MTGRLTAPRSPLAAAPSSAVAPPDRKSSRERGYTAAWDKASKRFLADNPLCRGCRRDVPATVTDHVVPHKGDAARFWDQSNWQPACGWHHDVVKQALERLFEAGVVTADDLWLDSPRAREVARRAGLR